MEHCGPEGRDDRQVHAQGETYEREGKEGTELLVPNMFDLIYWYKNKVLEMVRPVLETVDATHDEALLPGCCSSSWGVKQGESNLAMLR